MKRRTFGKLALGLLADHTCRASLPIPQAATMASAGELFPQTFAWGAATSAMQVEGYPYADGGGRSIWSVLDTQPARVTDGSNNLIADDSFHRYRQDIALLKGMGLNSYRLSVGWPRVLPEGRGAANAKALGYYDQLIDGLLHAGIDPWVTVYHFDYPEALEKQGGWLHPDSSQWFADYASLLSKHFGDRVGHWMTINEPNITWSFGWEGGSSPPFRKLDREQLGTGAHNMLLGHGRAVSGLRAGATKPGKISLAIAGMIAMPATDSTADREAATAKSFSMEPHSIGNGLPALTTINNPLWLDPIYLGRYSEATLAAFPVLRKLGTPEALATIHQPLDFCAVNLYFASRVRAGANGSPEDVPDPPDIPRTAYNWPITPDILYWGPRTLFERYRKPIVITENGMARRDALAPDGHVHDPERSRFLQNYLKALLRSHRDGVPLQGYFHWSLLDNWEFDHGFSQQFGLVYVDRKTLRRVPKDSSVAYAEIVRTRGRSLG